MRHRWTLAALGLFLTPVADLRAQATFPDTRAADDMRAAGDMIVAWVRANTKWGPDHSIVRNTAKYVGADINRVNNATLTVGSGLTKSGKPYQLCVWAGQFFVFELTDDEEKGCE